MITLTFMTTLVAAAARTHDWAPESKHVECSRTCHAERCEDHNIVYGNFCGATNAGCDMVEPCDAYDRCCLEHTSCVDASEAGVADVSCHRTLDACLHDALQAGQPTWLEADEKYSRPSNACGAEAIVASLSAATRLAIAFARGNAPPPPPKLTEEEWRAQVAAGTRPYDALTDKKYQSSKMKEASKRRLDSEGSSVSVGADGQSASAPQMGKARVVQLEDGGVAYFAPKPNGGFRLAFKPTMGAKSGVSASHDDHTPASEESMR